MIGAGISPSDRRTLVVGVFIVGALFAGLRGVPAWRGWRAEQRAAAADALARAVGIESTVATFSGSLDTLESRTARLVKTGSAFLVGNTEALASSMLAGLLAEAARASLLRLDAVETRVLTSDSTALPRVVVELRATGDVTGLAALLQKLEGGPTVLAIRRLSVRPESGEHPSSQPELLSIRLTVEGLALVLKREMP